MSRILKFTLFISSATYKQDSSKYLEVSELCTTIFDFAALCCAMQMQRDYLNENEHENNKINNKIIEIIKSIYFSLS